MVSNVGWCAASVPRQLGGGNELINPKVDPKIKINMAARNEGLSLDDMMIMMMFLVFPGSTGCIYPL